MVVTLLVVTVVMMVMDGKGVDGGYDTGDGGCGDGKMVVMLVMV